MGLLGWCLDFFGGSCHLLVRVGCWFGFRLDPHMKGSATEGEIPIRIPNHQGKTPIYHCIESYRTHHELKISWNFRCWTLRNLRKKGKAVFKSEIIANFQAFVPCFPNHVPSIFQLIGWFIIHVFMETQRISPRCFSFPPMWFSGLKWPSKNCFFAAPELFDPIRISVSHFDPGPNGGGWMNGSGFSKTGFLFWISKFFTSWLEIDPRLI